MVGYYQVYPMWSISICLKDVFNFLIAPIAQPTNHTWTLKIISYSYPKVSYLSNFLKVYSFSLLWHYIIVLNLSYNTSNVHSFAFINFKLQLPLLKTHIIYKSHWSIKMSSASLIILYDFVSSANNLNFDSTCSDKSTKKIGC